MRQQGTPWGDVLCAARIGVNPYPGAPAWQSMDDSPDMARTWHAMRRWSMAAAVAGFPMLFIIDERFDFASSPVLPGIAALIVIWVLGPILVMEFLRTRRPLAGRFETTSKVGLGAAFAWLLLWLVLA